MKRRKVNIKKGKQFTRPLKIMWFSNDPMMPTGYAKVTREVCSRLAQDPRFEVFVVAEGYTGAPKPFMNFTVYGAGNIQKPKKFVQEHIKRLKPDIVVALEDTFTLYNQQFHTLDFMGAKFIVYTPMDGMWIPSTGHDVLRRCDKIISMANFTHKVLANEGFNSDVIWHGVDLHAFKPVSEKKKMKIRERMNLPKDKFIFFNFGRNSMRKFNHRMLRILSKVFLRIPNSVALLNIMHYNAKDLDLQDFLNRHLLKEFGPGVIERLLFNKELKTGNSLTAVSDEDVVNMIQASDMVVSASTGEGSGLLMPEAMACMKPIVHTDYSTPYEWLKEERGGIGERGVLVPVRDKVVSSFNVEHGHVDEDKFVEAIIKYHKDINLQKQHVKNGRLFVERYANWDYLVEQWKKTFFKVV